MNLETASAAVFTTVAGYRSQGFEIQDDNFAEYGLDAPRTPAEVLADVAAEGDNVFMYKDGSPFRVAIYMEDLDNGGLSVSVNLETEWVF